MEYREEFLEYLKAKGYRQGTIVYTEIYLDNFFSYLKEKEIYQTNNITPTIIEDYKRYTFNLKSKRTKKNLTLRVVFTRLNVVKKYFYFLNQQKYILIDPAKKLSLPKLPNYLPKNILNEQEIKLFLEKPNIKTKVGLRNRAILELFYSTGIRRQELINLNIYDIDEQKRTIRINKGKNQKDRVVPIGKIASIYLEKYLRTVRNKNTKSKIDKALFITIGANRLKPQTLNYTIKKYTKKICREKKVSCHTLRHSCATHMLRGGASLRAIQKMLGHSSLTSTQIYTKISPIDLKEAHRKYHPRGKSTI